MKYTIVSSLLCIGLLFSPFMAEAATLYTDTPDESLGPGSRINIRIALDTGGTMMNAIEGMLTIEGGKFESISESGSGIGQWVEAPSISDRTIRFSGMTPGGFSGNILLFQVQVLVETLSPVTLSLTHGIGYLHDGHGTSIILGSSSKTLSVTRTSPVLNIQQEQDTRLPEPVETEIYRLPSWFGARYLAFTSQDAGSGIDRYERILPDGISESINSPYKLPMRGESLRLRIVDHQGNVREEVLSIPADPLLFLIPVILALLGLMITIRLFKRTRATQP